MIAPLDLYLSLPKGNYRMPDSAGVTPAATALIPMEGIGITHAQARYPCLGTESLATCTGIALYNLKTRRLVLSHDAGYMTDQWEAALAQARHTPEDLLHCHVIGGTYNAEDADEVAYMENELRELADAIAATPNVVVKTFDVGEKPHPSAFVVDARNGRLVRGTEDIVPGTWEEHYLNDYRTSDCEITDLTGAKMMRGKRSR